jgi:hypothetical protein
MKVPARLSAVYSLVVPHYQQACQAPARKPTALGDAFTGEPEFQSRVVK